MSSKLNETETKFTQPKRVNRKKMKLQPLYAHVMLEIEHVEATSAGGLILPTTATGSTRIGVVKGVGHGRLTEFDNIIPMVVKVGDRVMYDKTLDGVAIKLNGKEYIVVEETAIIGVVTEVDEDDA